MRSPIHVFYFKSGQNRCTLSGRKFSLYWWQKNNTRFVTRRCNPSSDFPRIIYVSAHHNPSLTFRASSRSIQVWGRYDQ